MAVKFPSTDDLARVAGDLSLSLTAQDLESFRGLMANSIASYSRLDELIEPTLPVKYPRTPGVRPLPEDNPFNAWYWRTEIKGAPSGPLVGKTVAIKDNVCVAGVPMMNGCAVLEGYMPEIDATIVTRILDAGARSWAKRSVRIFACPVAVTRARLVRCEIHIKKPMRLVDHRVGAVR